MAPVCSTHATQVLAGAKHCYFICMSILCCRDAMAQLLQNRGGGASIPYMFLPGNHEVNGLGFRPWRVCRARDMCMHASVSAPCASAPTACGCVHMHLPTLFITFVPCLPISIANQRTSVSRPEMIP